jgi:hypothetical protein
VQKIVGVDAKEQHAPQGTHPTHELNDVFSVENIEGGEGSQNGSTDDEGEFADTEWREGDGT